MPINNFSPTLGVLRGQQVEQGLAQAELEGMSLRDREALRTAAAGMGSQNYFAGYEGIPGAERPGYLKQLYASGDPEAAIKMETFLAQPFALQREITKAGEIERAKKTADMEIYTNAFKKFMGGNDYIPSGDARLSSEAPSIPAVGEPSSPITTQPKFAGISGNETSLEIGPLGPKFTIKSMSPFEKLIKIGEDQTRRVTAGVASDKEKRETIQQTHDNVRKVSEEIAATQKAMQNRDVSWEEGRQRIEELNKNLATFAKQRDQLLSGMPAPAPSTVGAPAPMSSALIPGPAGGFTGKEQGALDVKDREEKITAANKEITNARLGAEKVMKFKRQVGELYDLVTKQDIGHPTMEGIPGAANVLTLNRANAQVKKLNEAIINMFAEPGQSQMMNTIVERQMQGAVVPSLFTDPQLNKINAAVLRSNVEHLQNFPTFLEKWQKSHGHTLDGAADAWVDYTENNPLYTYERDARGKVTVHENSHITPIDKWMKLKQTGGVRRIGNKTFIKQDDGSWVER